MAFGLEQVLFTTLTRLTLVFNETLDPGAPANIDISNYVVSGDARVDGNFDFSGSSVSFDLALAENGKVYDITVDNIVSTQSTLTSPVRRSFFFGIGVVVPFLVNSIPGLGSLYIISDSALVGPVIATSNPSSVFGTVRGEAATGSYNELLSQIPAGGFYKTDLVTTPYRTKETHFLFLSGVADLVCGLYINDVLFTTSQANFEGWVGFSVVLPSGDVFCKILLSNTVVPFNATLVNSKFMTWQAALADSLGQIDHDIQRITDSRAIERVNADDIEGNFGQFVKTLRVDVYSLEVYRELLIEIIQAFKYWSATPEGLTNVMAAFTQIRPILKWMRRDAPRWVLGWQHLRNREMTIRPRFVSSGFPSTNIVALTVSDSNETGAADILWSPGTATLQYSSVPDVVYGDPVTVTGPGNYTLVSDNGIDSIVVQVGTPLPVVPVVIPATITGLPNPEFVTPLDVTYRITGGALFHLNGLVCEFTVSGADPSVEMQADPTTFEHLGELFVSSFWVRQSTGFTRSLVVEVSEDAGVTWVTGTPVAVLTGTPLRVDFTESVGMFGVTDIRVRLRGIDFIVGETFLVEKAALHSPQTGALYLGRNTRPRFRRRKFFAYQLLQFLREPLETQAFQTLGFQPSLGWSLDPWSTYPYGSPSYGYLPPILENSTSTAEVGLVKWIVPTHVEIDVFQDSVFASDDSGVVNVRGVVYETEWRAGIAQNFTVIPRLPDRFSHLVPSTMTHRSEVVVFSGLGLATLTQVSLEDVTQSRLLRNGIPIPNPIWVYADSTHIQLTDLGELDQSATYEFFYTVVISFASDIIDLGVNFGLFNWYADWYEYNRASLSPVVQPQAESIQFSSNSLLATLSERADVESTDSTLYQNNGRETTIVSTTAWSFLDPATIKINADIFDPDFAYSVSYSAQSLIKTPIVTSVVEVAYSTDSFTFSDWVIIPHDAPFGNKFRYWKFRVSVFNVGDTRDYKLRSMVLKGDPLDRTTIRDLV